MAKYEERCGKVCGKMSTCQQIKGEHQKQLEALRTQSSSTAGEVRKALEAEATDSHTAAASSDEQPSEEALRNLDSQKARFVIRENPTVKAILTKNIQAAKEKMREEFAAATSTNLGSTADFDAQKDAIIKEKEPLLDEIAILRNEMVKECIHPKDHLVHMNTYLVCRFCERRLSIPRTVERTTSSDNSTDDGEE